MPIYEYQCQKCSAVSELFTNVGSHSDQLVCKSCGSSQLEKLLSVASISTADAGNSSCSPKESCYTPTCKTSPGSG